MVRGTGTMERLRADLLRRARNDRSRVDDVEQQNRDHTEMTRTENRDTAEEPTGETLRSRGIFSRLPPFPRPLTRRNVHNDEGPKSPEPPLRPLTLASSRYGEPGNPPSSLPSPIPMTHLSSQGPLPPEPVAMPAIQAQHPGSYSNFGYGTDPRQQPVIVAEYPSESQQQSQAQSSDVQGSRKPPPKRFMFCFPWVKSRRVRSQILTCFVSGLFLAILLAVYLGLALTNHISRGELTIMIILVILSATMFFCYSVIRLCVLVSRGDRTRRRRFPEMMGPGGYVVPPKPIPVVLARDEEAAGIESEAGKSQPPAYGLWRESVRVDPNRLFWQRNAAAESVPQRPETRTGPRPPSYASDDGISYVVEARPRSMAPPPQSYSVPESEVPAMPRI